MDRINAEIYMELEKNARITLSELASKVALSTPAVSDRLKRMENEGYIKGYTVIRSVLAIQKPC